MSKGNEGQAERAGRFMREEGVPPHSPGLEERVMQRLSGLERGGARAAPRRLVAAWGAVAIVVAAGIFSYLVLPERGAEGELPATGAVKAYFAYPDAKAARVVIAGDFTDWQEVAMERREEGWSLSVALQQGETYRYIFLVDGACAIDPAAAVVVRDDFGCDNSVISL